MLFNLEGSPRREDLKMRSQHSDRMLGESPLMAQECGQYCTYTEESLDFSTKAVDVTRGSQGMCRLRQNKAQSLFSRSSNWCRQSSCRCAQMVLLFFITV